MRTNLRSTPRVLVPLSFFVVAVVLVEAALSPVGFGASGAALLLLVSALLYLLAAVALLTAPLDSGRRLTALGVMAICAVALHVADPTGPVIAIFLVAALTPLTGHVKAATVVLLAVVLAYNAVQLSLGSEALIITIATDAGCAFFYLFGTLVRTERAQREAVDELFQQLRASQKAEREASRVAERAALAREMHDVLAHSMSGLLIQLSGARLLADATSADPQLVEVLDKAHRLARSGLDEARRAVRMLREEALPGLEAIPRLLQDHADAGGQDVDWRESGTRRDVSAEVELTIYRWVQESLSNVRKHAPNQAPHLHLTWSDESVSLEAWNEVARASLGDRPGGGYGLRGMAERAHSVGGTLDINHTAHHFRTTMRLPLTTTTATEEY